MKYVSARMIGMFGVVLSIAALAGCSDGPSNSEVMDSIIAQQNKQIEMLQSIGGKDAAEMFGNMVPSIESVDVQGCEEVRKGTYRCSVEVEASLDGKASSEVASANFSKRKDGSWAITD
ncbi:hypothetical protein [Pseudomonas leptonychotis]|uniref:hypothetical protein n=1 Tax=Pseudomonas leptonychotis TaxID=2448482 RepID=UPI0039F0C3E3